ncbi:hypothetical protein MRY16398_09060 [Phytobacter sp. MRY16-398]|nr:hypothetical protein MRY16398_09060 [Phytobacter sp. MRY16-398]
MQNRQINAFAAAPELFDKRLGVQLAIEGEKKGDGMRHHDWRIRHHARCRCNRKVFLLPGGKGATTLPYDFTDFLT